VGNAAAREVFAETVKAGIALAERALAEPDPWHGLVMHLEASRAGALRPDVTITDVGLMLWGVVNATVGIREVAPESWRRHVSIMLDGLRAQAAHPLPGAPLEQPLVAKVMSIGG
jgi:hypothetical protein